MGAKVVLAELAHVNGSVPIATPSAEEEAIWRSSFGVPASLTLEAYRRFGLNMAAVADSLGATHVPTHSFGITGQSRFCARDPIHFNAGGSEALGEALARYLLGVKGLFDPR
jgi:hypothetical protein